MTECHVCFRHCNLEEGQTGFCGGRICRGGNTVAKNYGVITGLALDPIEKKPLRRFHPGEWILSVGSFGCNLRCPFCQNHSISWSEEAFALADSARRITPEHLVSIAESCRSEGNIGIAFTYNEPLIGYEFVRDAARLCREAGMLNVVVTNGTAEPDVLNEIAPYIDAMNIDLKGFRDSWYSEFLSGNRRSVLDFICRARLTSHIELTTLIVPGENDSPQEMKELSSWIANTDPEIPLHITRFYPRFHMTDRSPTQEAVIRELAGIARQHLRYVYA